MLLLSYRKTIMLQKRPSNLPNFAPELYNEIKSLSQFCRKMVLKVEIDLFQLHVSNFSNYQPPDSSNDDEDII